ncbi:hypothetical protein [Novosphingobium sp. KN65.2]|uniref:hypothetical protein n=1 Tax=Novosphingobium sp. KN65.2 TaxID=1478134 RepID=UPI0005E94647|nr:hypothetical protein [Novosphingobium sp. KN65.2]CDO37618.1 hypothetical protein SPHV1_370005 [Novosphingobium sp. KN65.2]
MRIAPPPVQSGDRFTASNIGPVPGIDPVDGWTLYSAELEDSDGFWKDEYIARGPERDVHLDVSRNRFTPSQDRFAWLVKHGFPRRPKFGPWDDTDIELRISMERAGLAA